MRRRVRRPEDEDEDEGVARITLASMGCDDRDGHVGVLAQTGVAPRSKGDMTDALCRCNVQDKDKDKAVPADTPPQSSSSSHPVED